MSSHAHSFGWVRSGLIALATLAVVAVALGVYQRSLKFPSPKLTQSQPSPESATSKLPIPSDGKATGIELVEDVQSPGGMRPMYESYDPNTGHLRFSLEAEAWHPAEGKKNLLEIQQPRIRFRDPAGRWLTANAERGRIELSRGASDSDVSPKSGNLTGGVSLQLDRMTDAERAALPPEKRDGPDPSMLVNVQVEELAFDLEYATLQCLGSFSIEAAEGSLKSRDLSVRYNEADAHFETLKMGPGVEVLIRDSRMLGRASTNAATASEVGTTAEKSDAEADGGVMIGKDGIPVILSSKAPRKNAGKGHRYLASFLGPIAATELQGTELVSEITAELVEVMFSLGSGSSASFGQSASKEDSDPAGPAPTVDVGPTREFRMACAGELDIRWQGALNLDPKAELPGPEVVVTGSPLKIKNPQIDMEGGDLLYESDSQRLVMKRATDSPLRIDLGNGLVIVAEGAEVDRAKGEVNLTGPGWVTRASEPDSPPATGATEVQFTERVTLRLAALSATTAAGQPVTTAPSSSQPLNNLLAAGGANSGREYVRSIETAGRTTISQNNVFIQAEWVQLDFGAPTEDSDFLDQLQRISASGDVLFSRGGEIMTCDDLEATLEPDPTGELAPTWIDLRGHVQAARGERKLAAEERITLEFTSVLETAQPFDVRRARMEAVARGLDPLTLNWSELEQRHAQNRRYRAIVRRVEAKGNVEIDGGRRGMGLRGHQVTGTLDEREEIEFARIIGAANAPAEVRIDSYAMRSRIIELDRLNGRMYAPGDGEMLIQSAVGLDGQPSDQPVDVRLHWTDGLEWKQDGQIATARMTGVISATGTRVVPAVKSVSWFDEATGPTLAAAGAELVLSSHPANPILSPAAQAWAYQATEDWLTGRSSHREQSRSNDPLLSGKLDQADLNTTGEIVVEFLTAEAGAAPTVNRRYGWLLDGLLLDSPDDVASNLASGFAGMPNRPDRLIMTREATITSSTLDAASQKLLARNTIRGTGLTLNLTDQTLTSENPGLILIEDYEADRTPDAASADPFARVAGQEMSQTQLTWGRSVRFVRSEGLAEFLGDVQLIHVSGQAMHGLGLADAGTTPSGAGRKVRMRADKLNVLFSAGTATAPSAGPLRAFVAEDRVYVEYAETQVEAGMVGYFAEEQLLKVKGPNGQDAQVTNPQGVLRYPDLEVDLKTQQVRNVGPSSIILYPR